MTRADASQMAESMWRQLHEPLPEGPVEFIADSLMGAYQQGRHDANNDVMIQRMTAADPEDTLP